MDDIQNEPQVASTGGPSAGGNVILGIFAGVFAAMIAVGLVYYLSGILRVGQAGPILLVGPLVGAAMRFTARSSKPAIGFTASILTFIGATIGFALAETKIYVEFIPENTVRRMLGLQAIIVFGFSMYLAFVIARVSQWLNQ